MKKLIDNLAEALETDNTAAIRHLGREAGLDPEGLIVALTEAAGILHATKREPSRSEFYNALMTLGRELDSPGIAWGILERKRREAAAEARKNLFGR